MLKILIDVLNGATDFFNGPLLVFSILQQFYKNIVAFSGIQTQIVRLEGTHADHSTNTAQISRCYQTKYLRFHNLIG